MLEFIVWGAGRRGRRLKHMLGNTIRAFIDRNSQSFSTFEGVPVISFADYRVKYYGCPIIVSPLFNESILETLADYSDIPIINMAEEPSEVSLGIQIPFDKIDFKIFDKGKTLYIYGINIFSILLYDYLQKNGWREINFIPGNAGIKKSYAKTIGVNLAEKIYPDSVILCTEKNIKDASSRFPFNRIEDFWNLALKVKDYHYPELKKFHNIHNGKRLFIVATGPSLKITDLDYLYEKHELSMSVNMIYRCFDRTKWRPNYYVFEDMYGLKEYESDVRGLNLSDVFLSDVGISGWSSKLLEKNMHIYHLVIDRMNGWPRLSPDISSYISGGGTVLYSCLQIAFYMGFKEIYLLGADCEYHGYAQNEGNHFCDGYCKLGDKQPRNPFPLKEVLIGYQAARHYAEERGIKIYNATRGGCLEVFERVDFDRLF